jgi:hypothetical protein
MKIPPSKDGGIFMAGVPGCSSNYALGRNSSSS